MAAAGLVNDEGVPLTLQAGRLAEVEVAEPEQGVVLPMDGVSTLGVDGRVPVVGQEAGLAKHVTLNEGLQAGIGAADVAAVERGREFVADGQVVVPLTEEARQWTLLPEAEVQDFCRALDDSVCVRQVPNADGGVDIFCAAYAPEVVARVAARANAAGELTAADAGEMVTVIALDAMHADAGATVDSVCKMFDGAGVYEALGDGDADVGRVRAAALVRECKERMGTGTNKLGMAAIERLVDARVEEVYRASGRDVARLNPRMKKADGVYEAWDARKDDARWHELKHLYLGLRRVFNPGLKEGLSHEKMMDEFDENAQEFYNWYADGVGKEKNAEYKAALKDWYMAQVSMRLADAYMGGGRYADGAGGYAADVAVARDVLKQGVPEVLNADVLARQREEAENAAAGRAAVLRKEAGKRYEQLRGLKAQRDMSAAREAKAKRAAEEKAAREEEKRVKAEEKAAAAKEKRRLAMARAQRRQARWVWDGSQKVDGEVAECSVPETLWEAMVDELGYDGETVPYILVGGKKVQVTGLHAGDGVRLNTTAAMLVQQAKKRDKMRASGELDFSFKF